MFRRSVLISVIAIICAIIPWGAAIAGRVHVGGTFDIRGTYDNNIFLEKRDKTGTFFTTIEPALNLSYRGPRLDIDAESGATFFIYPSYEDLSDQFFNQRVRIRYKLGPRLSLEAEDLYTYVNETIGKPETLSSNLVQSNSWRVRPIFQTNIGSRSRGKVTASYGRTHYLDQVTGSRESPDFDEARVNLYLDRDVTERILVYTTQEFTDRDYDKVDESSFTGLLSTLGFRWRIGRTLSLDASGGYNWLKFDEDGNQNGRIIDVALHYTPNYRTRFTAGYSQLFTSDVIGQVFQQDRVNLGVERQVGPRTLLKFTSFFTELDQIGRGPSNNNFFGGNLGLVHKLRPRIKLLADADWQQNGGGIETDDYEIFQVTIGLRFEFQ